MKRQKTFFNRDSSKVSVSLLNDKAKKFLKEKFGLTNSWCPDYFDWYLEEKAEEDVLDVIFFGDMPRKFLELNLNPYSRYRFWVLSSASKILLSTLYNVPAERIGVIPRYELFPAATKTSEFKSDSKISLVYAGQLREEKSILLMLFTVWRLQQDYKMDISLDLYGDFFQGTQFVENERLEYKAQVLNLLESLDWINKPVFHGFKPKEEWLNSNKDNTVYLNFSHYLFEDFNTSIAEAESKGFRIWASNWGGHQDIDASFNLKIPFDLVGADLDISLIAEIKSIGLSEYIYSSFKNSNCDLGQKESSHLNLPELTTKDEVNQLVSASIKQWGTGLYFVLRNDLNLLMDSQRGYAFLKAYKSAFGASRNLPKAFVVINHHDGKSGAKLKKLNWSQLYKEFSIEFIEFNQFYKKSSIEELLKADKIIISEDIDDARNENLAKYLQIFTSASIEVDYV